MTTATMIPPQPSWQNDDPTRFATGFQYVAHVPPMAIGPQMRGPVRFQGSLGVSPTTGTILLLAGVAALSGLGIAWAVTRRRRRRR